MSTITCKDCKGSGVIYGKGLFTNHNKICAACSGTGRVPQSKEYDLGGQFWFCPRCGTVNYKRTCINNNCKYKLGD
jgi:DnaJ-class molecular chaperone